MSRATPALILLATLYAACAPSPDGDATMDAAEAPADAEPAGPVVQESAAHLEPASGSEARGTVRFQAREVGGVTVSAELSGLPEGTHAYHVHEYGDCTTDDASSAGPHFPFVPMEEGAEPDFITGNLGEIEAGEDGAGRATREIPVAELNGPRAIPGRAVVVHQRPNDTTAAPTGDTGPRIACGVIGIVSD